MTEPEKSTVLGGVVESTRTAGGMLPGPTLPPLATPIVSTSTTPSLPPLPPTASNLMPDEYVEPIERPTQLARAPAPVKPAVRTSEFWLTAVGSFVLVVSAFVMYLTGHITQSAFVTIVVVSGGVVPALYALLRTVLKIIAPTVVVPPSSPPI